LTSKERIMSAHGSTSATLEDLQEALERRIAQRTFGRVQHLEVHVAPGRVTVRGYASCYYDKQLAIQAVLEVLGGDQFPEVALEIEVGPGQAAVASRRNYQVARAPDRAG
jgi:hypothetical protein